jgi:hypothetical protein
LNTLGMTEKLLSMKIILFLLLFLFARSTRAQIIEPLKLQRTITLQDVKGKFDHFAIDESGKRLFCSRYGKSVCGSD